VAEEEEQDENGAQQYQVAEEVVVITLIRCGTLNQRPVARDSTGRSWQGPVPPVEC